jgi:antitoxin component of MazEF toxin-antitoxin module
MTTITQTVIKIGDSAGVTLPAKALRQAGIKPGDSIKVSFEAVKTPKANDVMGEYAEFVAQYGDTLKNLAQR